MISKANKKGDKELLLKVENCEKSERKKRSSVRSFRIKEAKENNEVENEDKTKIDKG